MKLDFFFENLQNPKIAMITPDKSLLSNQLLRRGFLIETDSRSRTIFLSDNAYTYQNPRKKIERCYLKMDGQIPFSFVSTGAIKPFYSDRDEQERPLSDHEVLIVLLERMGLNAGTLEYGRYGNYELLQKDIELSNRQISTLFRWPVIRSEAFIHCSFRTMQWFREHALTPKTPLCMLEASVAIVVKALSAVGCGVWCSCEGHLNRRHIRCELMGPVNALWANYLLEDAARAGYHGLQVIRKKHNFCLVTHNPPTRPKTLESLAQARSNAIDIGQYLYLNRLRLRAERKQWLKKFRKRGCTGIFSGNHPVSGVL